MRFLPINKYIVDTKEVYEDNKKVVLVMEYLPGSDLTNRVKSQILSEQQIFHIFQQILNAVNFLHIQGICHRDIKLDNIMFKDKDNLKLLDFSLAENFKKNRLHGPCGTPGFMAPETFVQEVYDEKVDVFSLGILLLAMLIILLFNKKNKINYRATGKFLFKGRNGQEVIEKNRKCLVFSKMRIFKDLDEHCNKH